MLYNNFYGVIYCSLVDRFTFTMDGKTFPARLVDLPCVVETQKTLDRSTFFKSGDVGQMLIVYKVREGGALCAAPCLGDSVCLIIICSLSSSTLHCVSLYKLLCCRSFRE